MAGRDPSVDCSEPDNGFYAARCAGFRPGLLGRNGDGALVSSTFLSIPERPAQLLITGRAAERLRNLVLLTNKIYIVELYAAVDAIFELRGELWKRSSWKRSFRDSVRWQRSSLRRADKRRGRKSTGRSASLHGTVSDSSKRHGLFGLRGFRRN